MLGSHRYRHNGVRRSSYRRSLQRLGAVMLIGMSVVAHKGYAEPLTTTDSVINRMANPLKSGDVEQIQAELQQLLDRALPPLLASLQQSGTFYPVMAGLTPQNRVEWVGVPAALKVKPAPELMLKALRKGSLKLAQQKRFKAVALCSDYVALRKDTGIRQPGILVSLEHVSGEAIRVFIPYSRDNKGSLSLLTPEFQTARPQFFTL